MRQARCFQLFPLNPVYYSASQPICHGSATKLSAHHHKHNHNHDDHTTVFTCQQLLDTSPTHILDLDCCRPAMQVDQLTRSPFSCRIATTFAPGSLLHRSPAPVQQQLIAYPPTGPLDRHLFTIQYTQPPPHFTPTLRFLGFSIPPYLSSTLGVHFTDMNDRLMCSTLV